MKTFLAVLVVLFLCASSAMACNVATVSAFAAPVVVQSHCGVAVQAVQPVAVQAFAIPTVAVLQQPVVVQQVTLQGVDPEHREVAVLQQPVVVQQVVKHEHVGQQRVFSRSVVRSRTVIRN